MRMPMDIESELEDYLQAVVKEFGQADLLVCVFHALDMQRDRSARMQQVLGLLVEAAELFPEVIPISKGEQTSWTQKK